MLLTLAVAAAPAAAPSPGPMPPRVQGLVRPLSMSADVADYVRWSLQEMGQAVVVVEGEMGLPLPKMPLGIRIFDVNLSIFKPRLPNPNEIPMAPWVDTNVTMAGGNAIQKMYPLGWGY